MLTGLVLPLALSVPLAAVDEQHDPGQGLGLYVDSTFFESLSELTFRIEHELAGSDNSIAFL